MKIRCDQLAPSPSGLRCGLTLTYSEDGPIRFHELLIPWEKFSHHVRVALMHAFDGLVAAELDRDSVAEQMSFNFDL